MVDSSFSCDIADTPREIVPARLCCHSSRIRFWCIRLRQDLRQAPRAPDRTRAPSAIVRDVRYARRRDVPVCIHLALFYVLVDRTVGCPGTPSGRSADSHRLSYNSPVVGWVGRRRAYGTYRPLLVIARRSL